MLEKVFIENFLSISSVQELKVSNKITTLIGKNGSGKTSILKALENLNKTSISEKSKNIQHLNDNSFIKARFILKKKDVEKINYNYVSNHNNAILKLPSDEDLYYYIVIYDNKVVENYFTRINGEKIDRYSLALPDLLCSFKKFSKGLDKDLKNKISASLISKGSAFGILNSLDSSELESLGDDLKKFLSDLSEEICNWYDTIFPKYRFIYMNTFKDVLTNNISVDEIDNNNTVQSFLKIAGITKDDIISALDNEDNQKIQTIQNKTVSVVTNDFKKIFSQVSKDDYFKISMTIDTKSRTLNFWIQNKLTNNSVIRFTDESEGMQWYLSLYFKLFDYFNSKNDEETYILLIDEPNIYLHAEAQTDLLNCVFKKKLSNVQVIYSTHSPYMIDSEDLFSLRIVDRDNETKIYNNTISFLKTLGPEVKDSQVDILSPVLMAIGLNISNNLIIDKKDNVVVVEGSHDYYVLSVFKTFFKGTNKLKFIPCQGASKVLIMTSYLYGLGYKVCALLDNDAEGRKVKKDFQHQNEDLEFLSCLLYARNDIIDNNCLLEDLFSDSDRKKYLPDKSTPNYRQIFNSFQNLKFDDITINNFGYLFERINSVFKSKNKN